MRWGLPFAFLKDIPHEIFSIKLVKPAPRGNHRCSRTISLKNVQMRAISKERFGALCFGLYGVSSFAGSLLRVLGKLLKRGEI
jgi:hypothetical protein